MWDDVDVNTYTTLVIEEIFCEQGLARTCGGYLGTGVASTQNAIKLCLERDYSATTAPNERRTFLRSFIEYWRC